MQSVGKSLTFRGTVAEAQELMRTHRCKDPICDTHLWKVKHELDMAKMKMKRLESELQAKGIQPPLRLSGLTAVQQSHNQQTKRSVSSFSISMV